MHILHVIDALALGGAERMLVVLANRAHRDGHRVSVCVTRQGTALAPELAAGIDVLVLDRRRRLELAPLRRLAEAVRAGGVDVIHCHGRSSFSLLAVLAATRQLQAPILLHDHLGVELHPEVPRWFRVAKRYLSAYVGLYGAHATWAASAGVPRALVSIIPNALELSADAGPVSRRADLPPGRDLVFIGGLRREKGVDVLLEAMARSRLATRLQIIGGDADSRYAAACRERSSRADLAGRVTFLGTRRDALAIAATADVAVHPARSESGPLILLEYAAHEIPFIATAVGGIAEGLRDAGAGWFTAPEDPIALAREIDRFLELPVADRVGIANTTWDAARRHFDLGVVMPRWYALYERVAGERCGS